MNANTLRPLLLRAQGARASRQVVTKRFMEFDNGPGKNVPFNTDNKFTFGLKVAAFGVVGFCLPFVSVWWQNSK